VHFTTQDLFGLIVGTSFAAGLNVYATVATLGLLGHYHVIALPASLNTVEHWWVIGVCLALFGVEFIADKIPAFDLVWNALHTFVRVPVAALLAYHATASLPPHVQILSAILGGGIAFAAHGGKTAARAAVTPAPEPFSNSALSIGEDIAAVGLTWFATTHPYATAGIVAALLILIVLFVRFVVRSVKRLFSGAERELERARPRRTF
jgi:hypothetical protein